MEKESAFSKINAILLVVVVVLVGALVGLVVITVKKSKVVTMTTSAAEPAANTVKMASNEVPVVKGIFGITELQVPLGTPIMWSNREGGGYTLISMNKIFPEQQLEAGKSFSYAIQKPGEYFFGIKGENSILRVVVR